ncbi:MAG: hypothetical protein Ta2G_08720 [Termitinemataceae bacterium]|nr:MAG: hypothetical protein Ta2G_08720 [Termitinemataceae bacterium]
MNISRIKKTIAHNWSIKALCLAIAIFIFVFHRISLLENKKITVALNVNGLSELVIANNIPRTLSVNLRGNKEDINPITENDISAFVDLSDFSNPGRYDVPVRITKQGTALQVDPLEVDVFPPIIHIQLSVKAAKHVAVTPNLTGNLPTGYEMVSQSIDPKTVEIEGPEDIIKNISKVFTEVIDLSNRSVNFTKNVRILTEDPHVKITGRTNADFFGIIKGEEILRDFAELPVNIINLDEKFNGETEIKTVNLRVRGSYSAINLIDTEYQKNLLFLDCSNISEAGTYSLSLSLELPSDVSAINIDPESIEITVSLK